MKGLSTPIKVGPLRTDTVGGRNSAHATLCRNVRAHKDGLEGYALNISAFPPIYATGGVTLLDTAVDWPFPQLFQTDSGLYMGNKTGIYKLAYTGGKWIGTALSSAIYTEGITWPWTIANGPLFPVFASGDCLVYYDYDSTYWAVWNKYYHSVTRHGTRWSHDWENPVSVCFFKGQIITCGSTIASASPSFSRIVRWSEIGQFDFLGVTATTKKNTAGFTYAPTDDAEILLRCLPLEHVVVIYGTFSTFALAPVNRPAVTYAIKPVKSVGIANPLAVGGNLEKHLAVDRYGYLWLIKRMATLGGSDEVEMKKLGYNEFFEDSVKTVSVVYNSMEDEFYISDGVRSFLYNDLGLTEIGKCITSFVDYRNTRVTNELTDLVTIYDNPVGFVRPLSEQELQYSTDILDFGINGIKTIESVDIGGSFGLKTVAEVMVQWRNDKRGSFRDTPWKRCSPEGFVSPLVSGVEVKINLRLSTYTDVELNNITVKWKISDKRFIRGMYASSSNA
jgi:hypothetical protein